MVDTTDINRLMQVLEAIEGLLRTHGENFWAEWIDSADMRLRNSDAYGLDELVSFYDGIGSLNDLIICPENGHVIRREDEEQVNAHLKDLLEEASSLAHKLQQRHADSDLAL
jgi:hypothetical protein